MLIRIRQLVIFCSVIDLGPGTAWVICVSCCHLLDRGLFAWRVLFCCRSCFLVCFFCVLCFGLPLCVYRVLPGLTGWCMCCVRVSMYRKYSAGPANSSWLDAGASRVGASAAAGLINWIGGKPLSSIRVSNARAWVSSYHVTTWYVMSHPVQQHTIQNLQLNCVIWYNVRVTCLLIMFQL